MRLMLTLIVLLAAAVAVAAQEMSVMNCFRKPLPFAILFMVWG